MAEDETTNLTVSVILRCNPEMEDAAAETIAYILYVEPQQSIGARNSEPESTSPCVATW